MSKSSLGNIAMSFWERFTSALSLSRQFEVLVHLHLREGHDFQLRP